MVQARQPLIEGLARVSVVMMQPEHDARTRLHQNDRVAALLPAMMRETTGSRVIPKTRSYHCALASTSETVGAKWW